MVLNGIQLVCILIMVLTSFKLILLLLDPEITGLLPVDTWDTTLTPEQVDDEWLNYGERDVNPLYGLDNESF